MNDLVERLRDKVERLNVVVESRDAAVDCLEAEVATAYRQMNEAIDTAREAQAEVEALRAKLREVHVLSLDALDHAHPRNSASINAIALAAREGGK